MKLELVNTNDGSNSLKNLIINDSYHSKYNLSFDFLSNCLEFIIILISSIFLFSTSLNKVNIFSVTLEITTIFLFSKKSTVILQKSYLMKNMI